MSGESGRLDGRRILITGAAGGQGMAVARRFAADGARLALTDRQLDSLDAILGELRDAGTDAIALAGDVREEDEVAAVVRDAVATLGGLDVLYNNAGVYWAARDAPVDRLDYEVWNEILATNTSGVFLFAKHAMPHLLEGTGGVLLNVASVAAYAGDRACHGYAASKGALIALTKSIAQCYGHRGLRANVICPGFIDTPMVHAVLADDRTRDRITEATAMRRVGRPEEIASVAAFLASDDASFVTDTVIVVHGGLVK